MILVLIWTGKWSWFQKGKWSWFLGQIMYFPLWTLSMCFFNFSLSKKNFPHESHLWNISSLGVYFSKECLSLHVHSWSFYDRIRTLFDNFGIWTGDVQSLFPSGVLWPSWTALMCLFKLPATEKAIPHEAHVWSFWRCVDMFLQISSIRKKFTTRFTFEIIMNFINMFFQIYI